MTNIHCELFPGCMELGENATPPVCIKYKCPGRTAREFSEAFARAQSMLPQETPEEEEIQRMRAYLWASGISAGDAEFAARQLHRQGLRIVPLKSINSLP